MTCEKSIEMADGTRSQDLKKLEDSVRALKEHQERAVRENEEIRNSLKSMGEIKEMLSAITLKYSCACIWETSTRNTKWGSG